MIYLLDTLSNLLTTIVYLKRKALYLYRRILIPKPTQFTRYIKLLNP